jgi:hypothetical protein
MKIKNFVISGIIGGIVDFFLGWLLWGILFKSNFPQQDEKNMNMLFIFLGCMSFSFFMSYIFIHWAQITNTITGAKSGAIFGLFLGLYNNYFRYSIESQPDYKIYLLDIVLTVLCGTVDGIVIANVNKKID